MHTKILSAALRRWAVRLLVAILTIAWASFAVAQISEYDEPPSSPPRYHQAQPPADETAPAPDDSDVPVRRATPPVSTAPSSTAPARGTEFSYSVRPGDSLGSIAESFGLDADDLARANHLGPDAVLMVGKTLRIPNPFAAQVRNLSAQVNELTTAVADANDKAAAATLKSQSAAAKIESLAADNEDLRHDSIALPRWRGIAVTLGIVALLMFGVMVVTLFEWWLLRRRFGELVAITDSLTSLDQKYKRIVAKAELRFQQLYGRRRVAGATTAEPGKTDEEIEIERLNHELREALAHQLRRLGVARSRPRRNGRWREVFGDVETPVEARSARR
ncbi:MAG TPA: LysM peptidoglycan-binding domain-containing protein [Candidatus Binataceae bacterium]|nr:LysM peptidoglycan-binding domain-containing protein [Candidatus Binataceae bacterium]